MAINPSTFESWGYDLGELGEQLELRVLIAMQKAVLLTARNPAERRKAREELLATVRKAAAAFSVGVGDWIGTDLIRAYLEGMRHTDRELREFAEVARFTLRRPAEDRISIVQPLARKIGDNAGSALEIALRLPGLAPGSPHNAAVSVFAQATAAKFRGFDQRILRAADDQLARIVEQVVGPRLAENQPFVRRQVSRDLLEKLAEEGIHVITYQNGAKHSPATYAEMTGRTIAGRTAIQASLNRLEEYGYNEVRVTDHYGECPVCRPWENKILLVGDAVDDRPTLDDAITAGLFHPNCLHNIIPHVPGHQLPTVLHSDPHERRSQHTQIDRKGAQRTAYEALQRQRTLERAIRRWKRRLAVATDRANKTRIRGHIRENQQQIRSLLKSFPRFRRKPERERIGGVR